MKTKKTRPKVVFVSANDVRLFNSTWPCSSIPERACWFEFDDGDLVDLSAHLSSIDGPELVALSNDAQNFLTRN